jgi:hypothetical protein
MLNGMTQRARYLDREPNSSNLADTRDSTVRFRAAFPPNVADSILARARAVGNLLPCLGNLIRIAFEHAARPAFNDVCLGIAVQGDVLLNQALNAAHFGYAVRLKSNGLPECVSRRCIHNLPPLVVAIGAVLQHVDGCINVADGLWHSVAESTINHLAAVDGFPGVVLELLHIGSGRSDHFHEVINLIGV